MREMVEGNRFFFPVTLFPFDLPGDRQFSCHIPCFFVLVITISQLHSTKSELRFCAGSNPARRVSENLDGEDL